MELPGLSLDLSALSGLGRDRRPKPGELYDLLILGGGQAVILATGKRDRLLNAPGEKELTGKGVVYCATCDAPFFRAPGWRADEIMLDAARKHCERVVFLDMHQVLSIEGTERVSGVPVGRSGARCQ